MPAPDVKHPAPAEKADDCSDRAAHAGESASIGPNHTNSEGSGPWISPTHVTLYGSRPCMFKYAQSPIHSKGSRSGSLAKCFFGGLGYQGQTTTHFPETNDLLAVPPKAAEPKNHLAQKTLRDPFDTPHEQTRRSINNQQGGYKCPRFET